MNRIEEIVHKGNEFSEKLTKENIHQIDEWISESLLYVETKYPKTEFAKFFLSDVDSFRKQWIGFDIIDKDSFGRIVAQLKGIYNHEDSLKRIQEDKRNDFKSALSKMK